jgi:cysteine synthase
VCLVMQCVFVLRLNALSVVRESVVVVSTPGTGGTFFAGTIPILRWESWRWQSCVAETVRATLLPGCGQERVSTQYHLVFTEVALIDIALSP